MPLLDDVIRRTRLALPPFFWRRRRAPLAQGEPTLRSELFGPTQLENHARALAVEHVVDVRPGREWLLHRLDENERLIWEAHNVVADAVRAGHHVAPAAEWLLDNAYLIQEQIDLARVHLPSAYSRALPRLRTGVNRGLPRVYDLTMELVAHTDGRTDVENLTNFVRAYQTAHVLRLGELWATPVMLRLTLIENLRRVSQRVAWRREHRNLAQEWVQHFAKAASEDPDSFVTELADFVRAKPAIPSPFVAELTVAIEGAHPALGLVINWIEQKLADRGQSIHLIQQAERQDQAADQLSIANSITSLRSLAAIDWRQFVESLSAPEAALRRDPLGVYPLMDFRTRDRYRHVIEGLALRCARSEEEVAEAAVHLAAARRRRSGSEHREGHVGYFLIDRGLEELEREIRYRPTWRLRFRRLIAPWRMGLYLGAFFLLTIVLTAPLLLDILQVPVAWLPFSLTAVLLLLVFSRSAIALVNWAVTRLMPPRTLPRMDFSKGIPPEDRTAVVIPTFLDSEASVRALLERLEIHHLANRVPNLLFGLLSDFRDAAREKMPQDRALLKAARDGIRRLNRKYGAQNAFFLLHRPRAWNASEGVWMGVERKRGKLEEFTRLVSDGVTAPFSDIEADLEALRSVRYVITLDSDTRLPPESAWELVGTLAHPLNRPRINPVSRCVENGYGFLQPGLAAGLVGSQRSRFSRIFAGDVGIDPYTRETSNVYHDAFGHGQYVGKGIYDVAAFRAALSDRFPDNRVLSHDLIEGCFARCGFVSDIELIEEHPATYLADMRRRHRWVRGDWQIARWALPSVPTRQARRTRNPLGILARWMILDNLRRSLVPVALFAALLTGWLAFPSFPERWTLTLLIAFFLPDLARAARAFLSKGKQADWRMHLWRTASTEGRAWLIEVLELAFLPYQMIVYLDAIARVSWRLLVSHRRLLNWQTADAGRAAADSFPAVFGEMWCAPVIAVATAVTMGILTPVACMAALPVLTLWAVSPALAWFLGRPIEKRPMPLSAGQALFLRKIARRTWMYFEHFVTAEQNWLPIDNFQEYPQPKLACRTSPTNIGMALVGGVAAHDFGYWPAGRLLERTGQALSSMERMERYRGHFYNWYDTRTLQPLPPRYVSTVDSGNLVGLLLVLRAGLDELVPCSILPGRWRQGIEDTASVLLDELDAAPGAEARAARDVVRRRMEELLHAPDTLPAIYSALSQSADLADLEKTLSSAEKPAFWLAALRRQCEDMRLEILHLAPWLEGETARYAEGALPGAAADPLPESLRTELGRIQSLGDLATMPQRVEELLAQSAAACPAEKAGLAVLRGVVHTGADRAVRRIELIRELITRAEDLAENDPQSLYDASRKLLSLGFNRDGHRTDPGIYDLLASEARLASYVWIAQGALPVEHWFHLGRQLVPGAGSATLVSWSGSMFEYLMPNLVMPAYRGTLLYESCLGAVRQQIRYGRAQGVPWGFSESCYNQLDAHMTYQYRAFGVPALGLKRGLTDDLVVAPYASIMALTVAPQEGCANIERLVELGFLGDFGCYEAVDYTPRRVPNDASFAVVRAYMAHHSGMSLLSLAHALLGQPMQRRFMRDPRLRASDLILQERIPVARARASVGGEVSEGVERVQAGGTREGGTRFFTTAQTPNPEIQLLSNGRYHVMVSNAGAGSSRWRNLDLTRWREDATRDNWGAFFYLRDVDSGHTWSTTFQPLCRPADSYEVTFAKESATFRMRAHDIETLTEIAVSPEDDVELRRMTLTNLSSRVRTVELTGYAEVALAEHRAESAHPAFQSLFVQSEIVASKSAILFTRRPRAKDDKWPCLFCVMLARGLPSGQEISFETERPLFMGRGRNTWHPQALDSAGPLSNTAGAVLDPAAAIRRRIRLRPQESVTIDAFMGVSDTPENALLLIDKCHDARLADRMFVLAWTHSQVLLHQIRATESDARLFARLAGMVLYSNNRRRAPAGVIARNQKGQSGLWSYGISGDIPIVLLRVTDMTGLELVRRMLQAYAYWRHKGLPTDLVIWAEAHAGYRQVLLDAITGLVQNAPQWKEPDQPGGIFVRNTDQVPPDDRQMIQAVARIVLSDLGGSLEEQVERERGRNPQSPRLEPSRKGEKPLPEENLLAPRELACFNGLGGFTPDGREYVVKLSPGMSTPAPWVNVLANRSFGSVVSESGGAYTWAENAHEFRLTPWYNDPVCDASGEALYIRDEETGVFWSPSPGPAPGPTPYQCRHGLGYTIFEHTQNRIFVETTVYVDTEASAKFTLVKLRNLSDRARRLSVTGFCEWVLGELRSHNAPHIVTRLDPQTGAIFATNAYNYQFSGRVAYLCCSGSDRSVTADRGEFIGRHRSPAAPAAMRAKNLSDRVGAGLDPCAAIQAYIEIPPGEERQVVFVLGAARNDQEARAFLTRYGRLDGAREVLSNVWESWKRQLGGVYVDTPDFSVNALVNHWLPYQVLSSRFWGRSGFYQSGGAYGFRDQLQDSLSFLYECPWLTRAHLLLCAGRQFIQGDVQHWWHPPSGRGTRSRTSDDYLWLPYAVCRYVHATGDTGILDEVVPFLEGRPLRPGEESYYDLPQVSERKGTLYEHCVRAIRHGLQWGAHGLPLMGSGDWNDGMNRVGSGGQGESVWLAFFLCDVLKNFGALAREKKDAAFEQECAAVAGRLKGQIEKHAWDGGWYMRAFFDDGTPLGSARSAECRIDLLPQSWAVLSGAAQPERATQALNAALERLVDPHLRLVRLLHPPFDSAPWDPGYIKGYVPGARENGGQYTHAAIWAIMALAELGQVERAWELFNMINPVSHADSAESVSTYKVEPYVVAADIYTSKGHEGRGGWTWYTGSAGWMYQLLVETLLGLRVQGDTLSFVPRLPADWAGYTMHYRYRNTFYHIQIVRVGPEIHAVRRMTLDDIEQPDQKVHLADDQREHRVRVEFG